MNPPKYIKSHLIAGLIIAILLSIFLMLTRCTPFQRLQQLKKDAPELFESKIDSTKHLVTIAGSNLQGTGDIHTSSTFVSNTMSIVYFTRNNNYTVQGTCFPQVLTVTSYMSTTGINLDVYVKEYVSGIVKQCWWFVLGSIGVVIVVILLARVTKRILKI